MMKKLTESRWAVSYSWVKGIKYIHYFSTSQDENREATMYHALNPVVGETQNEKLIELPSPKQNRYVTFSIHAAKTPRSNWFSTRFFPSN